jgi:hypothetical protein
MKEKQAPSEGENWGGTKNENIAIALIPVLASSGPTICNLFFVSKERLGYGFSYKSVKKGKDRAR